MNTATTTPTPTVPAPVAPIPDTHADALALGLYRSAVPAPVSPILQNSNTPRTQSIKYDPLDPMPPKGSGTLANIDWFRASLIKRQPDRAASDAESAIAVAEIINYMTLESSTFAFSEGHLKHEKMTYRWVKLFLKLTDQKYRTEKTALARLKIEKDAEREQLDFQLKLQSTGGQPFQLPRWAEQAMQKMQLPPGGDIAQALTAITGASAMINAPTSPQTSNRADDVPDATIVSETPNQNVQPLGCVELTSANSPHQMPNTPLPSQQVAPKFCPRNEGGSVLANQISQPSGCVEVTSAQSPSQNPNTPELQHSNLSCNHPAQGVQRAELGRRASETSSDPGVPSA